ncbi:MAG: sigma 54-interacting transcriptional regulator [Vicinamibacteria bacterium]
MTPVLIVGESGTGKELGPRDPRVRRRGPDAAVRGGELRGPRRDAPRVGAGHARGSFTGAVADKEIFEQAGGGTVFLDEIGEIDAGPAAAPAGPAGRARCGRSAPPAT